MTYERIVVGTDGSAGSLAATCWTAHIAKVCGAKVTIVHSVAPLLEHMFSIPPLASDELLALVKAELSGPWSEPLREAETDFEWLLLEEYAAAALLATAAKKHASLLIVGRHGHTRWAPHVMGGVVHKVLDRTPCPVVIVPTSWDAAAADEPTDIVVGIDGSESSLAALDWGIRHAETFGTALRAVTAVATQGGGEVVWLAQPDEEKASLAAEEELNRILDKKAIETDVELSMQVRSGHAGRTLVDEAESAALVVVGSRGLGSVAELLVGSTSHYVATRSRCPTVIVT